MITFTPPWNEGRAKRSYDELKKISNLTLITVGETIPSEYSNDKILLIRKKNRVGLKNFIEITYKMIKKVKREKYDYIYLCNFYSAPIGLYLYLRKATKRLIYDAYELYIPIKNTRFKFRDRIFYMFEKKVIIKSYRVIAANEQRALIMLGHYRLIVKPVVVQNVGVVSGSTIVTYKESNNMINIVYTGYMSKDRKLIDLAVIISRYCSKYSLSIYGYGPEFLTIRDYIEKNKIENIFLYEKYSQDELPNIYSKMHVGYLSYPNDTLNNIYCSPNKIFDYALYHLPIIAFPNYTLDQILSEYKIGISSDDIIKSLEIIKQNYSFYSNNTNEYVSKNNWENESKKLINIFTNEGV